MKLQLFVLVAVTAIAMTVSLTQSETLDKSSGSLFISSIQHLLEWKLTIKMQVTMVDMDITDPVSTISHLSTPRTTMLSDSFQTEHSTISTRMRYFQDNCITDNCHCLHVNCWKNVLFTVNRIAW